jgi:hypothetical protein
MNMRMMISGGLAVLTFAVWLIGSAAQADEYLGNLSANPYDPDSTSNPYGAGSPYKPDGVKNPYSKHGSEYSNESVTNPYATDPPRLYDSEGNYRGKLSSNKYDPESTSNPYGRYGSEYSPDSINNPYGAGSPYRQESPTNPYGKGLGIYSGDDGPGDTSGADSDASHGVGNDLAEAPGFNAPVQPEYGYKEPSYGYKDPYDSAYDFDSE